MTKIMLVEDDKSLREIYSIRLAAEGYSIALAGDGEEALSVVVREKPDLIIADVMMPKISGFDMLDILRSQPETKNIKVIIMTALSSEDQRQRGERLGAEKYLVKSQVGIEDVINAVHEVLGDAPNQNAQANINITKAVGDFENRPSRPVASTNSTVVEPTSQNAPSAPAAPQGPIATPQDGGIPKNFNQAPVAASTPQANFAMQQPAAGATTGTQPINPSAANISMPQNQIQPTATLAAAQQQTTQGPAQVAMPTMPQNSAQMATLAAVQSPTRPTTPQPTMTSTQPIAAAQMNNIQNTLAQNAIRLQLDGINANPDQVMQQANLQAIQSMYSQLATQNSTIKPADRVLPNAQVAAIAAMREQQAATQNTQTVKEKTHGAGERVIQPLKDSQTTDRREEMQKRMQEMLGDDTGVEPAMINTKTAKHKTDEAIDEAKMVEQSMESTAESVKSQVQQEVSKSPERPKDIIPAETKPGQIDNAPVEAALQAQILEGEKLAEASAKLNEEVKEINEATDKLNAEIARLKEADNTTSKSAEDKPTTNPGNNNEIAPRNENGKINPNDIDLSKITLDTRIPTVDEIEDPGVEETVVTAVPGYLSNLEDELSNDFTQSDVPTSGSIADRMNAELLGDQTTLSAIEKAENTLAARKKAAEELIKNPIRKVKQNTNISPNIQGAGPQP